MKIIKIPKGVKISAFNGPTEKITPSLLDELMTPIEQNKAKIIDAAFDIERVLERIISHHFFKDHDVNKDSTQEFEDVILRSDWCTFAAKRKLITHIINKDGILTGQTKSDYDQLLRKTMSYRNAFAHGELATDGREVRLSYFEGNPKEKTLDDAYFEQVELELNEAWNLTNKVAIITGAHKEYK
ncbi:hypothetical protein [Crocinitomix algicola]|uniref:hypothetical protein n=1 Tax=Crocinitomix algicola TaxID=1740263 RepID=UPI0008723D14|nr:hypothetical protein [Crocinitomix algicola]